jgi:hypothetical protein
MKRSEMEQKLYEVLLRHIPEEASMNLAEDLLNACEKAGMKPPANDYDWVEYGDDFAMRIEQYEWDKE